jgi:acyl-CoA reductase-like NAD-dependent aldehyde dehydrogenase
VLSNDKPARKESIVHAEVAVERAQQAFDEARDATPSQRAGWLDAVGAALERHREELIELAHEETHLGIPRLRGELTRTVFQVGLLAEEIRSGRHLEATIDHADPEWGMGPRPDIRRINEPLGVVGVFGASNFPFAFSVMGGDTSSAIAAGCAVVHKVHSAHLRLGIRTADVVVEALAVAGAPAGLFALVEGRQSAETIVDHPLVRAVGFAGSTAGGRALFDRAVSRPDPIPFYGELGSTNPVFVTASAWAERSEAILAGFMESVSLGMGQFCTKPGFLIIPETDLGALAEPLRAATARIKSHPLLSHRLDEAFHESLSELQMKSGGSVIAAGSDDADAPGVTILGTDAARFIEDPALFDHEMFGPASVVVGYRDNSELLALAGLVSGQLTTSIHGNPGDDIEQLSRRLRSVSGRVLWNAWPTGVSVTYAQNHGGPYPAATITGTSVGTAAIGRFMRAVAYQDFPHELLPLGLRDDNPLHIPQRVDGA